MTEPDRLLNQKEAAAYLSTTVGVLNTWRHNRDKEKGKVKIPFVRIGSSIKYRKSDLDAYIAAHTEYTEE